MQKETTGRTYQSIRLPEAREHVRRAGQFVLQTAEEYEPVVHRAFSLRRKIGTVLAAALAVWLFFHVVLGANGALAYGNKRNEYKSLQKDVDQLQEQNEQLRKHIEALKGDPAAIEREAREQLHYAKPGEIVYVAPAWLGAKVPGWAFVSVRSEPGLIVVMSFAVLLAVLTSPPPETVAVLVRLAAALAATFTVRVIGL